jgi:hypothetical protein
MPKFKENVRAAGKAKEVTIFLVLGTMRPIRFSNKLFKWKKNNSKCFKSKEMQK